MKKSALPQSLSANLLAQLGDARDAKSRAQSVEMFLQSFAHAMRGNQQDAAQMIRDGRMKAGKATGQEITIAPIPFYSLCEHHLLPFFGTVEITYVAGPWILGLGKFPQVVDILAARTTLQESLTAAIADILKANLGAKSLSITLHARHLCLEMRGSGAPGTALTTTAIR